MLKLYHAAQSRSVRPRWMLEEIGAPYELARIDLSAGDQKKPEYLKINPNGTVPTLIDGDLVLFESAAIVQYLADKFPEKHLAPTVGTPARGKYYQWIHYSMSAVEPPAITIFMHTMRRPENERIPQLVAEARPQLAAVLKIIDNVLAGNEYILGSELSGADVMLGSTLTWCMMMGLIGSDLANVQSYLGRLSARPALQRASAD